MTQQRPSAAYADDRISALADGALQGDDFASVMRQMADDDSALAQWHCYHVVGDVLRSDALGNARGDLDFLRRLEARLAQEPAYTALPTQVESVRPVAVPQPGPAANADVFRWKMVAGFASVAAVAAIGWQALQLQAPAGAAAVLAQDGGAASAVGFQQVRSDLPFSPEVAMSTAGNTPVMLRNAQLDELLAAHNRAVGGAALQSQVRLLRNVSVTEDFSR